jgi:hypothetical protein
LNTNGIAELLYKGQSSGLFELFLGKGGCTVIDRLLLEPLALSRTQSRFFDILLLL